MLSSDSSCYYYFDEVIKEKSILVTCFLIHVTKSTYLCGSTSLQSSGSPFLAGLGLCYSPEIFLEMQNLRPQNLRIIVSESDLVTLEPGLLL